MIWLSIHPLIDIWDVWVNLTLSLIDNWMSFLVLVFVNNTVMNMHVYVLVFNSFGYIPGTAKSLQSCPTLCDPIDGSPPGSSVPGILQARTLEWVATSFSNAWKWKVKVKSLSHIWLLGTPWTAAYQAPPSMGFSRQEYWSGVPLPSPGYIPRRRITRLYSNFILLRW